LTAVGDDKGQLVFSRLERHFPRETLSSLRCGFAACGLGGMGVANINLRLFWLC
jgi:hypothetical protein